MTLITRLENGSEHHGEIRPLKAQLVQGIDMQNCKVQSWLVSSWNALAFTLGCRHSIACRCPELTQTPSKHHARYFRLSQIISCSYIVTAVCDCACASLLQTMPPSINKKTQEAQQLRTREPGTRGNRTKVDDNGDAAASTTARAATTFKSCDEKHAAGMCAVYQLSCLYLWVRTTCW